MIAAWKLLNLSFLATPLGLVFSLAAAILALYDDFKTFQEGGRSLINWGSDFTKMMVGIAAAVGAVAGAFYAWKVATTTLSTVMSVFNNIMKVTELLEVLVAAPVWAIVAAVGALIAALVLADEKWKIFGGNLSGFASSIGGKILSLVGGGGPNLASSGAPLGSTPPANQTNVNANMQTSVNVVGSPNADATARAVAGQQTQVNRDMVRNMKNPTR